MSATEQSRPAALTIPRLSERPRVGRVRAGLTIAWISIYRFARDRTAFVFTLVLPVLVIIVVGAAFPAQGAVPLGVVSLDDSPEAQRLIDALDASPSISVERLATTDELDQAIRRSGLAAGVVIPAGLGDALRAGRSASISYVSLPASQVAAGLRTTLDAVAQQLGAEVLATRFVTQQVGAAYDEASAVVQRERATTATVPVEQETVGQQVVGGLSQYSYTAPANLVLFVFINATAAAAGIVESRRVGILRRILATPVGSGTIVVGTTLGKLLYALIQSLIILVLGGLVFGVQWGNPLGAALLVMLFALVSSAAGVLVGAVANDPDRVGSILPPVGIALGMLGGCMWPLEVVPPFMQTIGKVTPQAWAMEGWVTLIFERGGLADILVPLAVLTGFAVVLMVAAALRLRRVLLTGA